MLRDIYYSRRSNKAVQVISQCRIVPDGTEAVCFQEMSGDFEVFVLAKEHFVKIFRKADAEHEMEEPAPVKEKENRTQSQPVEDETVDLQEAEEGNQSQSAEDEPIMREQEDDSVKEESAEVESVEGDVDVPGIIRFLDADTYERKMKVLESMRDELDDRTLNNMAVSLDLTIDPGVDGYSFLMSELRIRSRYEGKRGSRL